MRNRTELAKYFGELGFKSGAEIGTCYGAYAERLYQNIPGLKLIAVDNWDNPETSRRERDRKVSVETKARAKLAPYGTIIVKKSSMEAVKKVPDESLDFVYIDAGHTYKSVKEDIREWSKKVRPGGIVSGHDYYEFRSGRGGIIPAVDEYVKEHGYELHLTDWDKENPAKDERQPSWWFKK